MRKQILVGAIALALALVLVGCAPGSGPLSDSPIETPVTKGPAGFWLGLWHGFIALFTFIISLFRDDVGIYELHNKGHLYDLGYILGVMAFFGGSGKGCCKWK